MPKIKPIYYDLMLVLINLVSVCVFTYFIASEIDSWSNWYWIMVGMVLVSGYNFVAHMKRVMSALYRIQDHFEVITMKGVMAYGEEIKLTLDGKTVAIVHGDTTNFVDVSNIRFVDEITQAGTKRMTWSQFIMNANKEK